jgi:hypothetical protein
MDDSDGQLYCLIHSHKNDVHNVTFFIIGAYYICMHSQLSDLIDLSIVEVGLRSKYSRSQPHIQSWNYLTDVKSRYSGISVFEVRGNS